jgi:hypothetical protein
VVKHASAPSGKQEWHNITAQANTSAWPQALGSHYAGPYNVNMVWQDTSSNATYCSAASALSLS